MTTMATQPEDSLSDTPSLSQDEIKEEIMSDTNEPEVFVPTLVPCDVVLECGEESILFSDPLADSFSTEPVNSCLEEPNLQERENQGDGSATLELNTKIKRKKQKTSEEVRAHWNMYKVFSTLGTHEQCIRFAEQRGLLATYRMCSHHRRPMTVQGSQQGFGRFRCSKRNCRTPSISRATGTWFQATKLPLPLLFQIMYLYSIESNHQAVQRETCHWREHVLSQTTVIDWFNYCKEAIITCRLKREVVQEQIGGVGKVVYIEESKYGETKFKNIRNFEDHWVLGFMECGTRDIHLEVGHDNVLKAEVLVRYIKKHVRVGTTIYTDLSDEYNCLPEYGYIHKKTSHNNHNDKPVEPEGNGNGLVNKSNWRTMKRLFRKEYYVDNFTEWLIETSWKKNNKRKLLDSFEELLKCVIYVYGK